jgi:RNA methyltransferase, TrmH family
MTDPVPEADREIPLSRPVPRGWRSVESPRNENFRLWESLLDGRGLKKHGQFLLSGRKTVPEALQLAPGWFNAVIAADPAQISGLELPAGISRFLLPGALFQRLDVIGTGLPLLVGTVPAMPPLQPTDPPQGLELVCALGDPANLGALLRSAAAFGVSRVILLSDAAHPFHPRCLRAASNAVLTLELRRCGHWADLNQFAGPLLALDAGGGDLAGFDWPDNLRLILGEEGLGLPAGLTVQRAGITTTGRVESLNATVAASIALHGWFNRRGSASPA